MADTSKIHILELVICSRPLPSALATLSYHLASIAGMENAISGAHQWDIQPLGCAPPGGIQT